MSWFWKFLINEIEHESRFFPSVDVLDLLSLLYKMCIFMVKDENSTTRRNMIHTNCLLVLFIFIRTLLLFLSIISISAMHRTLRPGPGAQLNGSRKYTEFTPDIRSLHFSTFCLCFAWRSSTSAQSITLTLRQCSVAEQIERIDHTDNRASSSNAFSELIMCS